MKSFARQRIPPTEEQAIAREVDGILEAWRAKALHIILAVLSIVMLPMMLAALIARVPYFDWPLLLASSGIYVLLVTAALRPRWPFRRRFAILIITYIAAALVQLLGMQLTGTGRITLIAFPLIALVLAGPRAGWAAACFSAALFAIAGLLSRSGHLSSWHSPDAVLAAPTIWLMQGFRLTFAMLTLLVLFTSFHNLQRRTLIAERTVRRQLEAESAERARLEAEILRISEEERRRLGAELHDGLCQHLTAVLLHSAASAKRLAARELPEAAAIRDLGGMIEESIGLAYDVAKGLCPLDMTPDSLESALQRLARSAREKGGNACEFSASAGLANCPPDTALHLYRIAQEAVANAVKHAGCRAITISLAGAEGEIVLTVADDGAGQGGKSFGQMGGMGIPIMAYRAGAIGGKLAISRPDGGGTVVTCRAPLARKVEPA